MLRLKKLKKKIATEEGPSCPHSTISEASGDNFTQMVIENVPRTISVASSVTHPGSTGSISSDGLHVMGPKYSDDETSASGGVYILNSLRKGDSPSETTMSVGSNQSLDSPHECSVSGEASTAMADSNAKNETAETRKRKSDVLNKVPDEDKSAEDSLPQKKPCVSIAPDVRFLASSDDTNHLNPLHTFIRKQIEVFTASPEDMAQPAPGRKTPVKLNQVGLRCTHCKHLSPRDRVKRAVCYPTSLGRVYHSVSDMKFDHFSNCRGLSPELRAEFESLKLQSKTAGGKNSGSSTSKYYQAAAMRMGMVDGHGGIYMGHVGETQQPVRPSVPSIAPPRKVPATKKTRELARRVSSDDVRPSPPRQVVAAATSYRQLPPVFSIPPLIYPMTTSNHSSSPRSGRVLLSSPLDEQFLNPLHCFVRRNVEVFAATPEDIAAPSPGRKTRVAVGQIGLRCIHCAKLPAKERVKRTVCYPPSVGGIYHSVSNMKFDHFGKCRGLPEAARAEFESLRESCSSRRGGGSNNSFNDQLDCPVLPRLCD